MFIWSNRIVNTYVQGATRDRDVQPSMHECAPRVIWVFCSEPGALEKCPRNTWVLSVLVVVHIPRDITEPKSLERCPTARPPRQDPDDAVAPGTIVRAASCTQAYVDRARTRSGESGASQSPIWLVPASRFAALRFDSTATLHAASEPNPLPRPKLDR